MTAKLESISAIQNEITRLKRRAEQLKRQKSKKTISDIVRTMRDNDINLEEVSQALLQPREKARSASVIKYQHPDGSTWTGRGRPPLWITDLEAAGGSREQYRITNPSND
ncbi:H-NS histone family protein [Alcaligenes faecalis]|uniref:H-NS histone family protein n=1 Tax=Alcaligenes TaxID=507 RepID=UPI000A2D88F7|nr:MULTISPECIES: H-NS histone family protein [Alcaligenes]MBH0310885.1 H-NS histone family protein [Alcaligenes faecalis]MCM2559007.1 H-NS histone family protein [Alcaligenes faecalis]MCM2623023.1 H-NS histone family protein [Alcaligenes faecalis]MCX5473019.1 H-NS histone family protein [Alcaligenes nematophilus]OSZ35735.1 DNA-binding protein [Alcaligenes faecalis]